MLQSCWQISQWPSWAHTVSELEGTFQSSPSFSRKLRPEGSSALLALVGGGTEKALVTDLCPAPAALWECGDPRLCVALSRAATGPCLPLFRFPGYFQAPAGCVWRWPRGFCPWGQRTQEGPVQEQPLPPAGQPSGGGVTALWTPSGVFSASSLSHTTNPAPSFSFLCPLLLCQTPVSLRTRTQVPSTVRSTELKPGSLGARRPLWWSRLHPLIQPSLASFGSCHCDLPPSSSPLGGLGHSWIPGCCTDQGLNPAP